MSEFGLERDYPSVLEDQVRACPIDLEYPKMPRWAEWAGGNKQVGYVDLDFVWPATPWADSLRFTNMFPCPQVSLQLASGAFLLNEAFCKTIQIPMEKLKWTSPFSCLRMSLVTRRHESKTQSPQDCTGLSSSPPPCDNMSLKSEAEDSSDQESSALLKHTGKLWATVVALAWLEHSSANYIIEWELVAAKASSWMEQQAVPEGRTLSTLKATARQLFVLLRHWDENLEFNMLCYNPNYM